MSEENEIKAVCTWGDGPDVSMSLEGHKMVLMENPEDYDRWVHGTVTHGIVDLTGPQAYSLGLQLINASLEAGRLDLECKEHDEAEE